MTLLILCLGSFSVEPNQEQNSWHTAVASPLVSSEFFHSIPCLQQLVVSKDSL